MGCFSGPTTTTKSNTTQDSTKQGQFQNNQTSAGSSNSNQTGQTSSNATSTSTPNLPDWFMPFKQAIAGQYGNMFTQLGKDANTPLYGNSQIADYQEHLNKSLGQDRQDLSSLLASQGALNSGRSSQMQSALSLGGTQQMQDYLAKIPLLNAENKQKNLGLQTSLLNGAGGMTVPYGSTTTSSSVQDMIQSILSSFNNNQSGSGTSSEQGTSNESSTKTQQQSGGFLQSLIGGLLNAGMGALTGGLSNVMGGGGFFGGSKASGGGGGDPWMGNADGNGY